MTHHDDSDWVELRPPLHSVVSQRAFAHQVQEVCRMCEVKPRQVEVSRLQARFAAIAKSAEDADRQVLLAAGLVITDLAAQGWQIRVQGDAVAVRPPVQDDDDRAQEKERVRRQELVKRDAQLQLPSVRRFLDSMERNREYDGKFVSIFSLMRDGRDLADNLRKARGDLHGTSTEALRSVVDPYIQFVTSDEAKCSFTGLRLIDVWRYFRHTWTNQYTSVPGRSMLFLVRDRAAPFHPVACIGAIGSPVVQIGERDKWIGWHPDTLLAAIRERPPHYRWYPKAVCRPRALAGGAE